MIRREDWQDPAQPVRGLPPMGTPGTWVIHYPGGGTAPYGDDVAGYLRNIQSAYLRDRGYSIGYNWGVSQDGVTWELRGDDFNNAANVGGKVEGNFNHVSQSVFVMVTDQDPATGAAVKAINDIIATHPDWDVRVHGDVEWTSCAGVGLNAQVRSGVIGHQPEPPKPPVDPIDLIEEEEIMIAYIAQPPEDMGGNPPWMVCINGAVRYATNVDAKFAVDSGWAFVRLNREQYDLLRKGANLL